MIILHYFRPILREYEELFSAIQLQLKQCQVSKDFLNVKFYCSAQ